MATSPRRLHERGVEIELTEDARTLIGNLGYDPTYGARPLKRVIQKRLVDRLALKLLEGEFEPGDRVLVGAADGDLDASRRPPPWSRSPPPPNLPHGPTLTKARSGRWRCRRGGGDHDRVHAGRRLVLTLRDELTRARCGSSRTWTRVRPPRRGPLAATASSSSSSGWRCAGRSPDCRWRARRSCSGAYGWPARRSAHAVTRALGITCGERHPTVEAVQPRSFVRLAAAAADLRTVDDGEPDGPRCPRRSWRLVSNWTR